MLAETHSATRMDPTASSWVPCPSGCEAPTDEADYLSGLMIHADNCRNSADWLIFFHHHKAWQTAYPRYL